MSHRTGRALAAAAAVLMVAAGCSSSSKSSSGGSGGTNTYTVGLLTDLTGPGAVTAATSPKGVEAGIGLAAKKGYHIKYVVADTGTSPTGTLAAAQKLVYQDHVFAVFAISALTFAASSFLASRGIPVIGPAYDGPEWITTKSMFSVYGYQDYTKVETTEGLIVKKLSGTDVGAIGTGISPSSSESAKAFAVASQYEGLKVGYLNPTLPFGTTNVGPIVLAMKAAGVNAVVPVLDQGTAFALLKSARQNGLDIKVALLATGGGGDLFAGGPGAEQAAQGAYFLSPWEPPVMRTAAVERFENALKTYAGVTSQPTQAEYNGYTTVDAFVTGLQAAGPHPTRAAFINAMLGIRSYNDAGLFGSHSIGFAMDQRGKAAGADNCTWITRFSGSDFHLVPGMEPLCGVVIPGKTVSASS